MTIDDKIEKNGQMYFSREQIREAQRLEDRNAAGEIRAMERRHRSALEKQDPGALVKTYAELRSHDGGTLIGGYPESIGYDDRDRRPRDARCHNVQQVSSTTEQWERDRARKFGSRTSDGSVFDSRTSSGLVWALPSGGYSGTSGRWMTPEEANWVLHTMAQNREDEIVKHAEMMREDAVYRAKLRRSAYLHPEIPYGDHPDYFPGEFDHVDDGTDLWK